MQHRSKHEVIQDIEVTRSALSDAWQVVRFRNPVSVAMRATKATVRGWRNRAATNTRVVENRVRATPYRYIGFAVVAGAVAAIVARALKGRRHRPV